MTQLPPVPVYAEFQGRKHYWLLKRSPLDCDFHVIAIDGVLFAEPLAEGISLAFLAMCDATFHFKEDM